MSEHIPPRLGVSYELLDGPPAARADAALIMRVRLTNTGAAPWSHRGAYPVNLAYHWLDPAGQVVDFEGVRAGLPGPLRPGESAELELTVEPPPGAGQYLLALDLVEEGHDWFSSQGVPMLQLPLTVAPGMVGAPRACIINGNCTANDAVGNHVLNQLRALQARGYHTVVLVEEIDRRQPPELRQHIAQLSLTTLREGLGNPQTRRAITQFLNADLYVFNYSTYYELAEAITLVERGVVLFDYHGITPPQLWEGPERAILERAYARLELLRYADYAVAHSEYMRAELIASGLIAPERAFVNRLAAPLARFRPGPRSPELLARYGLAADQPVLLYVGRMATNKRIETLVQALPLIAQALPEVALLLVGDAVSPPYARTLARARALAEQLGVAERLIVTGQVHDHELADHYRLADVFVVASLHEGFCVPAIEAMACGVPVVAARAAALPETVGSGGLTFTPEDPADLAAQVIPLLEARGVRVPV